MHNNALKYAVHTKIIKLILIEITFLTKIKRYLHFFFYCIV